MKCRMHPIPFRLVKAAAFASWCLALMISLIPQHGSSAFAQSQLQVDLTGRSLPAPRAFEASTLIDMRGDRGLMTALETGERPLPDGNIVIISRKTEVWDIRYYVLGALLFCAASLIVFLFIQRHRKRSAEDPFSRRTEERDHFFNVTLDLLCIANTDGYFLHLNPAWERILGHTREELMGKRFLEFVHPDDLDGTGAAVSTLTSQQKIFLFENRYRCKDGTYRWLQWSATPIGKLIYAAARDITEHKLDEEVLQERIRFERLVSDFSARFVNISPDRVDPEIEHGLGQILEFFRVDRCAMLQKFPNKTSWQITHVAIAEGVPPVPRGVELPISIFPWAYEKLIDKGEVLSFSRLDDLPAEADVDRQTWMEWGIRSNLNIPIMLGGNVDQVLAINSVKSERPWRDELIPRLKLIGEIFANALERKEIRLQIEERLRFEGLISNLSAGFVNLPSGKVDSEIQKGLRSITEFFDIDRCTIGLFSEDGTQLVPAFEYRLAGAESAVESMSREQFPWYVEQLIRGKPVVMNRVEDLPPEAEKERQLCLAKGMKSLLSIPIVSGGKNLGSCAFVSTRAERVWPEDMVKRVQLVSEVFANVLDRRRANAEAFHTRRELMHLERLSQMGELTASLAHELNQPLTAILSNAGAALRFLHSGRLDLDELKEILQDIANDDRRAGNIIRTLRLMVKREEGEPEPIFINDVLQEMVSLFHSETILRNLTVEIDLADALPPLHGNKVQIQQVLVNLMMNAADAMESEVFGKKRIVLQSHAVGSDAVRVAVRDFGPGIGEAKLGKIFEPFFTTKRSGLGMGLSLSRSIIEAHRGRIWVENNPDQGATFYFEIPSVTKS
jgi:PAS domain S-box-containing protein